MLPENQPIQLSLTLPEINVILEALGQMPFVRVHQLIADIHQQAEAQLRGNSASPSPTGSSLEPN